MTTTRPAIEPERLEALAAYRIMDTPREPAYDELSDLAAQICGCPIAYVSLVDAERMWFKSACGFPPELTEVPRDVTVCGDTVYKPDLVVIPDLTAHATYADLPVVRGEPHLRFYCGAPLINPQGFGLGTICVMDFQPREITQGQQQALRTLAHQVAGQLELRRNVLQLGQSVTEIQRVRKQVDEERSRSEALLLDILPKSIATELREKGKVEPRYFPDATLLFTDFQGFTKHAATMEPGRLVGTLDQFFTAFDEIVGRLGVEKLKTIGDAYMCAAGVPQSSRSHAADCCLVALEMRGYVARMNRERIKLRLPPWPMRIGIHSGPVMAGVVGRRKFTYDVWGDAVNVAQRMEQAGEVGRINVSEATAERVKALFEFEPHGAIETKSGARIAMQTLLRIRPELSADADGVVPNDRFRALAAT